MKIDHEQGYTEIMEKSEKGTAYFVRSVWFTQKGGKLRHSFTGVADVYSFTPDDPKCKVSYLATVRGVEHEVMCGSSGAVGQAILKAAKLTHVAKNANGAADYVTYPMPIGCPATLLQDRALSQSLVFYKKV